MKSLSPALQSFFVTLIISLGVVAGAQFVAPTSTPPNGNVTAPINSGSVPQVKQAALGLTGLQVGPTPGVPSTGYTLDVTGAGVFGSLITANARVVNIATVPNTTIPVCADATGNLGVCGGASPFVVTLSASPTSVASGSTTTLTWNAPTATSCTASGPGFTTGNATSGSDASTALTSNTTFSVTCANAAGATQTASTTVAVTTAGGGQTGGGTTTVNISANSTTITAGQSVTLTWPLNPNILSCDASWIAGTNNGTGPTSTVSPTATTTYTISCVDDNGATGTDSVTVTVNAVPTVVNLTATILAAGGADDLPSYRLNWTTTPAAASCAASTTGGGAVMNWFTGAKAGSGNQTFSPQSNTPSPLASNNAQSVQHSITCNGVTDTVTIYNTYEGMNDPTTGAANTFDWFWRVSLTNGVTAPTPVVSVGLINTPTWSSQQSLFRFNLGYSGVSVTGCTRSATPASSYWTGPITLSSTQQDATIFSAAGTHVYTISCNAGAVTDSVTVQVP